MYVLKWRNTEKYISKCMLLKYCIAIKVILDMTAFFRKGQADPDNV